ncbi:MAG: hypothetical protein RLZZ58_1608, partial [Pseudomonadota bacterium]
LQGAIASIINLTYIIGPPMMSGVFGAYSDKNGLFFPGAPYLLATLLIGFAILILNRTLRRYGTDAA